MKLLIAMLFPLLSFSQIKVDQKLSILDGKVEFLVPKELSKMTGIALPTLRRWRHERKGPSYVKINRMVRYDYDRALEFMAGHEIDLGQ